MAQTLINNLSYSTLDATKLSGNLPEISGANLTTLNASNVSSGTLAAARYSGGKVGQIVSATMTDGGTCSNTSFIGFTNVRISITPSATSSKILVMYQSPLGYQDTSNDNFYARYSLRRDIGGTETDLGASSNDGMQGFYVNGATYNDMGVAVNLLKLDSPNTTSQIHYDPIMRVSDTGVAMTYKITGETNLVAMEILA
mgnify:CR=1 FL=1